MWACKLGYERKSIISEIRYRHLEAHVDGECDDHYDRMSFIYDISIVLRNLGGGQCRFQPFIECESINCRRRFRATLFVSALALCATPSLLLDDYTITASHIVLVRRGRNHEEDGLDSHPGVLLTAFACLSRHHHVHTP